VPRRAFAAILSMINALRAATITDACMTDASPITPGADDGMAVSKQAKIAPTVVKTAK
jgi:hypothetical protein